MLHIFCSDRV